MKIITTILLLTFVFGAQQAVAHGDHVHASILDAEAMTLAAEVSSNLSTRDVGLGFGQLPVSWASVSNDNIKIYKKGEGYYVVSVFNEGDKKTLFVLMSNKGEVYDVNFSGTFKGIK